MSVEELRAMYAGAAADDQAAGTESELASLTTETMDAQENDGDFYPPGGGEELDDETTIAAEVYLECEETFCVTDAETGVVLQGQAPAPPDGPALRRVGHVVTFEMTTRNRLDEQFPYFLRTDPGNWQMTDIDDLVSVKKWYHIP